MRVFILLLAACSAWGQMWYPLMPSLAVGNSASNTAVIDATGEMYGACGYVWTPTKGTKSINKVGFMFGNSITKAGGSALTVSLQDPAAGTGPPMQPDGTQDQTVAVANGSIAASTFLLTGALSADRSVAYGEALCFVVEFDGAGRLGSDTINFQDIAFNTGNVQVSPNGTLKTSGTWATRAFLPIMVFYFSDGTYGSLDGAMVGALANVTQAYNSGSSPSEYALKFTVPAAGVIDGVMVGVFPGSNAADFDVVLYSGTTALTTKSVDANFISNAASPAWPITIPIAETAVATGTTYYLSIKPTTGTSVTLRNMTVAAAAYLGGWGQGASIIRSNRAGGAWSDDATTVPFIKVRYTPTASSSSGGAYVVAQ